MVFGRRSEDDGAILRVIKGFSVKWVGVVVQTKLGNHLVTWKCFKSRTIQYQQQYSNIRGLKIRETTARRLRGSASERKSKATMITYERRNTQSRSDLQVHGIFVKSMPRC